MEKLYWFVFLQDKHNATAIFAFYKRHTTSIELRYYYLERKEKKICDINSCEWQIWLVDDQAKENQSFFTLQV